MKYQHIVNNIFKFLEYNKISISDLSKLSGVSLTGIKNMFDTGLFKLESLEKIAEVFNVPLFILIADEILIEKTTKGEIEEVTINYKFKDAAKVKVLNDGKKITSTFLIKDSYFDKQAMELQDLQQRVADLQDEIDFKEEKISVLNERIALYKESNKLLSDMNQSLKILTDTFLNKPTSPDSSGSPDPGK